MSVSALTADIIPVTADITSDTTWLRTNEYILTDVIAVRNNATLTIQDGTIVRGEPKSDGNFDPGALVVTREGQIQAAGLSSNPIIFTTAVLDSDGDGEYSDEAFDYSAAIDYQDILIDNPVPGLAFIDASPKSSPLSPGDGFVTAAGDTTHLGEEYRGLWGGVIILGNAPTNIMDSSGDELVATTILPRADLDDVFEGFIEGLDPNNTPNQVGVYGGTNPNDSSGTFKYVSIRHGGTNLAANNEINGLTMGGVGFGTRIEYVEVYCNNDDGFEFFGGTVNTRYLVSLYNADDSFDIDEGFTGLGQFWFSLQIDDGANGDHGGEHDGTAGNFSNIALTAVNGYDVDTSAIDEALGLPMAFPTIYNATYLAAGTTEQMLKFEDSFGCDYFNSVFVGAENEFIDVSSILQRIQVADCDYVSNSIIYNMNGSTSALGLGDLTDSTDASDVLAGRVLNDNSNRNAGVNPFATLTPNNVRSSVDPRVTTSEAGNTTLAPVTATFFITASYPGAFNPSESKYWTDGWSVFSASYDNK